MKKKWIVVLALLTLLVFGAMFEIQFVCEDDEKQSILAWRILPPWSSQTVAREPTFEWFLKQSGENRPYIACDARCYGLLARGSVIVK